MKTKTQHQHKTIDTVPGSWFKVFIGRGTPLMTIWARNKEEARLYCEGRLPGVQCKPIKYTRIQAL